MPPIEKRDPKTRRKRWTVMLYMVASKDERTESAAIRNVRELQDFGARDDLNLRVQIDRRWPGYPERYRITKNHKADICRYDKRQRNDSGTSEVLHDFVDWARKDAAADHYVLVLWGHAFGLGFGRDNGDPLTLPEIAAALDPKSFGLRDGETAVDILGVNACAMSYAEAIYELRNAAKFLVAPEITMPFAGWPYAKVLGEIVKSPDIKPVDLSVKIVEDFVTAFEEGVEPRSVALTAVNLRAAGDMQRHLAELTQTLAAETEDVDLGDEIADAFVDTTHAEVRPLIDLVDLCDRLAQLNDRRASPIVKAALKLSLFLKTDDDAKRLILKHKASGDVDGLSGLGIYAPSVTGAADLKRLQLDRGDYDKLALVRSLIDEKTHRGWADIVFTDLKRLLSPLNQAIAEFVNGTGAVGADPGSVAADDRTGVGQLLLSVHRSFVKLGKAVSDAQRQLTGMSNGKANGHVLGATRQKPAPGVVFGPPFLRLAPRRESTIPAKAISRGALQASAVIDQPDTRLLLNSVTPLTNLEDALAYVEKTTKQVMTHARLGLGGDDFKGDLGGDDFKGDLGGDDFKGDLGGDDFKGDLGGDDFKGDLGVLSALTAAAGTTGVAPSSETAAVAGMFQQVSSSLKLLEDAVATIENDLVSATSNSISGAGNDEYQRRATAQLDQSFRDLQEMIANAKLTVFRVLSHPANGLGPTVPAGSSTVTRQQLAIAGGLSSRKLRLL